MQVGEKNWGLEICCSCILILGDGGCICDCGQQNNLFFAATKIYLDIQFIFVEKF